MKESVLRKKAMAFAKEIVFLCKSLQDENREFVLSRQLLRAGTSIGANIYEANYGQSENDFLSKLEIAQKECFETEYWLELMRETAYLSEENYVKFHGHCVELQKMLTASVKTIKSKK